MTGSIMTITELIALITGTLTTLISITDVLLKKMFKKNRAFSRDAAMTITNLSFNQKWRLNRMVRRGIVIRISPALYYYNKPLADRIRKKQRKRAAIILPVILIIFIIIYFILGR